MIDGAREAAGGRERRLILYVEDNVDVREAFAAILRRAGFLVAEAGDGVEGFERALELCPDLVLMDLALPIVDGYEASARIKGHPRTGHIPIIALTAHAFDEARIEHCDGYIGKPLKGPELVRHVMQFFVVRRRGKAVPLVTPIASEPAPRSGRISSHPPPRVSDVAPKVGSTSGLHRRGETHLVADTPSAQPQDSTSSSQSHE